MFEVKDKYRVHAINPDKIVSMHVRESPHVNGQWNVYVWFEGISDEFIFAYDTQQDAQAIYAGIKAVAT